MFGGRNSNTAILPDKMLIAVFKPSISACCSLIAPTKTGINDTGS